MTDSADILLALKKSVAEGPDRRAFWIQNKSFTYREFAQRITAIRKLLRRKLRKSDGQAIVGVAAWDHISTYASIYAIWYEGHVFLPFSPRNPASRNNSILLQTGCRLILSSSEIPGAMLDITGVDVVETCDLLEEKVDLQPLSTEPDDLLYLLFTSGSTGIPKGVMLSRDNFNSFVFSFIALGYQFSMEDSFLQIYDLTFDASLHCYAVPLAVGASIYTVPWNEVKYMYALKLMRDHAISFAKMPPSTISFLRPYFKDIRLEKLRYCLFGGEALVAELAEEWLKCIPNASLQNVYGPTEASINCLEYGYNPAGGRSKQYQGIVSIGKAFGHSFAILLRENGTECADGEKGELCIAGRQVTSGYWKDEERNARAFINFETDGVVRRFYRTGDLCFRDAEGDIFYCGRLDNQVQIQGFRVELGEIEAIARIFTEGQVVALAKTNELGTLQLYLFVQTGTDKGLLYKGLKSRLPDYMIPADIFFMDNFPLNVSGKIDRKALEKLVP